VAATFGLRVTSLTDVLYGFVMSSSFDWKKSFWFMFRVLCGWRHKWRYFALFRSTLPDPGRQPNESFLARVFCGI